MKGICGLVVTVSLLVVSVANFASCSAASNLTYACYPNTTIKVENPGDFTNVFANNSVGICSTSWVSGNQIAIIENCEMDDDILVHFSNMTGVYSQLLVGIESASYSINCKQIPSSGVFQTISHNIAVAVEELAMTTVSSFDSNFGIISNIFIDPMGYSIATEVYIGTPLFWILMSNMDKYRIRPDTCRAYGGKNVSDTVFNKEIYNNGCTTDETLLTEFQSTYIKHLYGVRAVLFAFRFYNSPYITLECTVRVCPYDDTDNYLPFCEDYDSCESRKRRAYTYNHMPDETEFTVVAQFRVLDLPSGSGPPAPLFEEKKWSYCLDPHVGLYYEYGC